MVDLGIDDKTLQGMWENALQDENIYKPEFETARTNKTSMTLDFWKLDQKNMQLGEYLINRPINALNRLQKAVHSITNNGGIPVNITFDGRPLNKIDITHLRTKDLNKLHSIEGFVIQTSKPYSKCVSGVFQCRKCGNKITLEQPIDTDQLYEPLECMEESGGCGRTTSWDFKQELSMFKDFQRILIQNPFHHKQRIELETHIYDDHVGNITPGEWVTFNGVYLLKNQKKNVPEQYFLVRGIETSHARSLEFTDEENEQLEQLRKRNDIWDVLVDSFAPSVYENKILKEACLLQLFDGVWYDLEDGTTRRGSIHILFAGDPATVKSVLKQGSSAVSPRYSSATGKGCSVAGIIAGSRKDKLGDKEGWILDAGALVLANGGVCYLDEFDKMPEEVHGALHGPMEQGVVETSKICSVNQVLPSRTSIFAVMNPKKGKFDEFEDFLDQLDIDSAMLSRFDLIFSIIDVPNTESDRETCWHMHKTNKGELDQKALSTDFLRKYVHYAKTNFKPEIPDEIYNIITEIFVKCRDKTDKDGQKIKNMTFRQVESLRRLCQASARSRLSNIVTHEDVDRAWRVFKESLKSLKISDLDSINTGWSDKLRSLVHDIEDMLPASYQQLRHSGFSESDLIALENKKMIVEKNGKYFYCGD